MRESEDKGPREQASPFSRLSQRVIIVCFEMGVPYFKVRSMGILPPSSRTWKREEGGGERERTRGNGISLTLATEG